MTVHLAFDELEPVDLAFEVALTPGQSKSFPHCIDIPFEPRSEAPPVLFL